MILDNLRLACVQPPTSLQIRPLRFYISSSMSFGETFGNYVQTERTGRTFKLEFPGNFCRVGFAMIAMYNRSLKKPSSTVG